MKFNWTTTRITVFITASIITFIIVILFSIITKENSKEDVEKKNIYYERFHNINLSGVITNKVSIDNDRYSLYTIHINESTLKFHDLRDSLTNYFLVINGDTAKMVFSFSYDIFKGDSIQVDYKNQAVKIFRKKVLINSYPTPNFSEIYISKQKMTWK